MEMGKGWIILSSHVKLNNFGLTKINKNYWHLASIKINKRLDILLSHVKSTGLIFNKCK